MWTINMMGTPWYKIYKKKTKNKFQNTVQWKAGKKWENTCSPLSTPEGIVGTFRQCAAYQKDKNLDRFVSIVVLSSSCSTSDTHCVNLDTNSMISHEWGKDRDVFTTMWSKPWETLLMWDRVSSRSIVQWMS
jgi:hypothetical protein